MYPVYFMDEPTGIIQDDDPRCAPVADDIMLIDKISKGVKQRLGMRRSTPDKDKKKYTANLVRIRTLKLE